jgi:hypothetical protein
VRNDPPNRLRSSRQGPLIWIPCFAKTNRSHRAGITTFLPFGLRFPRLRGIKPGHLARPSAIERREALTIVAPKRERERKREMPLRVIWANGKCGSSELDPRASSCRSEYHHGLVVGEALGIACHGYIIAADPPVAVASLLCQWPMPVCDFYEFVKHCYRPRSIQLGEDAPGRRTSTCRWSMPPWSSTFDRSDDWRKKKGSGRCLRDERPWLEGDVPLRGLWSGPHVFGSAATIRACIPAGS